MIFGRTTILTEFFIFLKKCTILFNEINLNFQLSTSLKDVFISFYVSDFQWVLIAIRCQILEDSTKASLFRIHGVEAGKPTAIFHGLLTLSTSLTRQQIVDQVTANGDLKLYYLAGTGQFLHDSALEGVAYLGNKKWKTNKYYIQ